MGQVSHCCPFCLHVLHVTRTPTRDWACRCCVYAQETILKCSFWQRYGPLHQQTGHRFLHNLQAQALTVLQYLFKDVCTAHNFVTRGPFQNTQQVRSLSTLMKMVSSSRAEARYVYCPLWKIWVHKLKVLFCSKTYIPGVSWPGSPAQTLIFWQFYCCNKLSSCDPGVLCLLPLPMRLQQAKHSQLLTSSFGHTK